MPHRFLTVFLSFSVLFAAVSAWAAGTVQLEIVGTDQNAAMAFQDWGQAFDRAGIQNVRLRSGDDTERPRIETQGTPAAPVYVVTGILSNNEIILPGGRFRRGDMTRLNEWMRDLASRGPNAGKEGKTPFGLSGDEFAAVRKDLTSPLGFATKDLTYRQAVEKIAGKLRIPLKLDEAQLNSLGDAKIGDEFEDFTCGTALSSILRATGYSFRPRIVDGRPIYTIAPLEAKGETWSVGWKVAKPDSENVPALYEFRTVNIVNVSAAKALSAIADRVKLPVVLDRYALAKHKIDLEKAVVSVPRSGKTTYSIALRRALSQAKLQFEVRYDESDAPFLWVTTLKPI